MWGRRSRGRRPPGTCLRPVLYYEYIYMLSLSLSLLAITTPGHTTNRRCVLGFAAGATGAFLPSHECFAALNIGDEVDLDPVYPGTAVSRMLAIRERARSLTTAELSGDWDAVRRRLLWAAGLKDLPAAVPGYGYTGHSFNDAIHVDATAMLGSFSENLNPAGERRVQGIAVGNRLGPGIQAASVSELGAGGSWSTCSLGARSEPPQDVAHVQFQSRIAFKLVWCAPTYSSFVLVDDAGVVLARSGTPTGALPALSERRANFEMVSGSKYARYAVEEAASPPLATASSLASSTLRLRGGAAAAAFPSPSAPTASGTRCSRAQLSRVAARAAVAGAAAAAAAPALPVAAASSDSELLGRFEDASPRQWQASFTDALASGFGGKEDQLAFPPWMEGEWELRSRPLATAAPLGRRFLPPDLARMRIGDLSEAVGVSPLQYNVRFPRRASDGVVVSDRCANLRAVQDAAAGYARVQEVRYEKSAQAQLKVSYSPFGANGTYPGPSRAEIYIQWRRQMAPSGEVDTFAFAEATRTVLLAQQRSVTLSDAETLCRFVRTSPTSVAAKQRVLRYLTPNPNSNEGLLWQEAGGRAVAVLDYELNLQRVGSTPPLS